MCLTNILNTTTAMELFFKKHAFSGKLILFLCVDLFIYLTVIKFLIE